MNKYGSIYEYITAQENAYEQPININGWDWSMKQHVKTSFFYQFGRLLNGNDENTPVKNITRPILNLQSRAEDIDVKEIVLYVDNPDDYHLSFLVKRYHDDVFVIENNIDKFLDDVKESKIVYGGGLSKKMDRARPEVVPIQSIAFCDQTNLLGAPLGFKHDYNPDELKEQEANGWGSKENGANITIDELITVAEDYKILDKQSGQQVKSTSKTIEIYEVHGTLPPFAEDKEEFQNYEYQLAIVAFYRNKKGEKVGVTLFRKKQKKGNLKLLLRDEIYSRALGFGGAEELFEDQVWTTYSVQRQKDLLDATSKVILTTDDPALMTRHPSGLKNLNNLELIERAPNTTVAQIDTTPRSLVLFEKFEQGMKEHAQLTGGATDALLGESPTSGTPFKLQDLVTTEGQGLHEYRRKKFAKFIEEVYKDWIIPYIVKEITNGARFLSELSMDEMQYVMECVIRNKVNDLVKERILNGELIEKEEIEAYKQKIREEFVRGGNKKFIEILKGEFQKKPLAVKVNVAGAQKDLAKKTDKLVNIFRQIIANPQGFVEVMKIPGMAKTWNEILEDSGLTPGDFSTSYSQSIPSPIQPAQMGGQTPQLIN